MSLTSKMIRRRPNIPEFARLYLETVRAFRRVEQTATVAPIKSVVILAVAVYADLPSTRHLQGSRATVNAAHCAGMPTVRTIVTRTATVPGGRSAVQTTAGPRARIRATT